jgi:hypothetical protein
MQRALAATNPLEGEIQVSASIHRSAPQATSVLRAEQQQRDPGEPQHRESPYERVERFHTGSATNSAATAYSLAMPKATRCHTRPAGRIPSRCRLHPPPQDKARRS